MKSKTLVLLAIMLCFILSMPTIAANFLPSNVWEEMATWETNGIITHANADVAVDKRVSFGVIEMELNHSSFNTDIIKVLNELDGTDWREWSDWNVFSIRHVATRED